VTSATAPLALVVIALSMVPALQYTGWQWTSLVCAAPVALWGAWPLHRAALAGLRHAAVTMDSLVSLAVAASLAWSVYALASGGAGMAGMRMPFAFTFTGVSGQTLYFEVAAGVTTAVMAGRYLEAPGPAPGHLGPDRAGRPRCQVGRGAPRRG
jgi:Cu+-exporting ATPase